MNQRTDLGVRVALGQLRSFREEDADFAAQLGLSGLHFNTPDLPGDTGTWEESDLCALREGCEQKGLALEAIENVPFAFMDKIMTGAPGWEDQLERYCTTIENLGRAGISTLGYHFMPTFVWRTSFETPGRGGCRVSSFDAADVGGGNRVDFPQLAIDETQPIDEAAMWLNYERFLDGVLPVAERFGVTLALHPDDPPVLEIGGVARLFHSPEGFRRAEEMSAGSDSWALDLCLGSVSEMHGGAATVEEMIRWFGPRGKIAYVHFRDVQGTVPSFQECFLGEGNYEPAATLESLVNAGFNGFLIDDHVPQVVGDTKYGHRARAHAIGYMQGLLAARQDA